MALIGTKESIQCEEFYSSKFVKGAACFGREEKICPICGGKLERVHIYFKEGLIEKVCVNCKEHQYIDVVF